MIIQCSNIVKQRKPWNLWVNLEIKNRCYLCSMIKKIATSIPPCLYSTPFPILVLFLQYENRQYTAGNIYKSVSSFFRRSTWSLFVRVQSLWRHLLLEASLFWVLFEVRHDTFTPPIKLRFKLNPIPATR